MPDTIPLQNWLRYLKQEYLTTFIQDGGTAVKFVVTPDARRADLASALQDMCMELDYLFVKLNAVETRVHMPQDIFFGLARQIDWRLLARRRILGLAAAQGYQVEGIAPGLTANIYQRIAHANNLDVQPFRITIERGIQDTVFKSAEMARDFRVGMFQLCLEEDVSDRAEYTGQPLLDWLTGANTRIGNVRPFSIYTGINRSTARYFMESALHWVRDVGYAGTVILLDNSRVTISPNPRDGQRYYTRAMAMEHYELLREFVDSADHLTATLLAVSTGTEFLNEERTSKGYGAYPALRTRVMDDVRDRNLVNPVASLVRLA